MCSVFARTCTHITHRHRQRKYKVVLCHCLPFSFETEPGVRLAASKSCNPPGLLCGCWGFELRSSCLHSKHSQPLRFSPSPHITINSKGKHMINYFSYPKKPQCGWEADLPPCEMKGLHLKPGPLDLSSRVISTASRHSLQFAAYMGFQSEMWARCDGTHL